MAYEKQVWQSGDIVNAEKLNHMEDGISWLEVNDVDGTLDKTWQEIYDAFPKVYLNVESTQQEDRGGSDEEEGDPVRKVAPSTRAQEVGLIPTNVRAKSFIFSAASYNDEFSVHTDGGSYYCNSAEENPTMNSEPVGPEVFDSGSGATEIV